MLRPLSVCALLLVTSQEVAANGRPPGVWSIRFRQGSEQNIAAGTTFGLVLSHDGGQTWRWMCEDAVRYAGDFDPDYAFTSTGSLFATTIYASSFSRDGCSFGPTVLGTKAVSKFALGSTGDLFAATVQSAEPIDPGDSSIYRSTDDGATFPIRANMASPDLWWTSIEVAPSDPMRIYAVGHRSSAGVRTYELYKSIDGGMSFQPMSQSGLTTNPASAIDLVGISPLDPDHLYVRITFQLPTSISEAVFSSTNGGASWAKLRDTRAAISFLVRANGDLVLAVKNEAFVSRHPSNGAVWEALPGVPHINCLFENVAGEVWACTENYGPPSDGAGIMKSTDLATWSPVLRFEDIAGPVACAEGTAQNACVVDFPRSWCQVRSQLGVIADPTDPPCPPEGGDLTTVPPPGGGCCDASGSASNTLLCGLIGLAVGWPRRRRPTTAMRKMRSLRI